MYLIDLLPALRSGAVIVLEDVPQCQLRMNETNGQLEQRDWDEQLSRFEDWTSARISDDDLTSDEWQIASDPEAVPPPYL